MSTSGLLLAIRSSKRAALLLVKCVSWPWIYKRQTGSVHCYEQYVLYNLYVCVCVCVSLHNVTGSRTVNTSQLSKCPCYLLVWMCTWIHAGVWVCGLPPISLWRRLPQTAWLTEAAPQQCGISHWIRVQHVWWERRVGKGLPYTLILSEFFCCLICIFVIGVQNNNYQWLYCIPVQFPKPSYVCPVAIFFRYVLITLSRGKMLKFPGSQLKLCIRTKTKLHIHTLHQIYKSKSLIFTTKVKHS